MAIISPSLLSCNFLKVEQEIHALGKDNSWLHLDVMDSHFVPNLTFGPPLIKNLSQSFPEKKLDVHLMVTNPDFHIEMLKEYSIYNITFHYESTSHHDRLVQIAKSYFPYVGIALNPGTNHEILSPHLLGIVDLVLVMSVNPGFGGQSFIPYSLEKIKGLAQKRKDHQLNFKIQVDGGVSEKNSSSLLNAGADILVAGNYIFKNDEKDYPLSISKLLDQ